MYQIFADGLLIYDDTSSDPYLKVVSPKLKMEDNRAGSLNLTVPPGNAGYEAINRMTSVIKVKKDGEEIWEGRVLQESKDFWNQRVLVCEGELAYLNDTTQPQARYQYDSGLVVRRFLDALLTNHNARVSADKQFTLGAVTVTDPNNYLYRYTNYETTIACIDDKLIEQYGGHLKIRKQNGVRYLDYLIDEVSVNTQTIEFGKNLIDFARSIDSSEYATVIVPLGARQDESEVEGLESYLTVEGSSLGDGTRYVKASQEVLNTYGWIEKVVHWDDVTVADNLYRKAQAYLTDLQFDNMEIELSAFDLHYLNPEIEDVKVGDLIRVVSAPHGIDRVFPVKRLDIPLDQPQNSVFQLGDTVRTSLVTENNKTTAKIEEKLGEASDVDIDKDEILEEAQENANALMDLKMNGYVTIETSGSGSSEYSDTLYVSEGKPLRDSSGNYRVQRFWRWNMNGLGYTDNYGSTWKTALLMDGTFNTDRIAAGAIHGSKITANSLQLVTTAGDTKCTISLKDSNGRVVASAQDIQINGMVTFTNLNDPNSSYGGSATYIDGAHIKTGTIDVTNLRVQTVYYYDGTNYFRILSSDIDGVNTTTFVGPRDLNNGYAQWTNIYGTQIYMGSCGSGDYLNRDRTALVFDLSARAIYNMGNAGYNRWSVGNDDYPMQYMNSFEYVLGDVDLYGSIIGTSDGPYWRDGNGNRHYFAFD